MAESIGQKLIAEKAGVSRTTVSVVLNNRPTPVISERTRRRVLKVAKSMGYRPRPKITFPSGTHNLGILLPEGLGGLLANPLLAQVLDGIQEEAATNGFHLILAMPDARGGRVGPSLITQNKCDGVILLGHLRDKLLEAVLTEQTPAVVVGDCPPDFESVVADTPRAVRLAVEHLVAKGHRHIAYLDTPRTHTVAIERYDAFRLALLDHDLDIVRDLMVEAPPTAAGGLEAAGRLLEKDAPFTAVLCGHDITALGLISELRHRKKSVPGDFSVIGMGDIPEAARAGLTTIAVPKEDMGRLAVKKLLGKLAGDDTPANRSIVPVNLVERDTVASSHQS